VEKVPPGESLLKHALAAGHSDASAREP